MITFENKAILILRLSDSYDKSSQPYIAGSLVVLSCQIATAHLTALNLIIQDNGFSGNSYRIQFCNQEYLTKSSKNEWPKHFTNGKKVQAIQTGAGSGT